MAKSAQELAQEHNNLSATRDPRHRDNTMPNCPGCEISRDLVRKLDSLRRPND